MEPDDQITLLRRALAALLYATRYNDHPVESQMAVDALKETVQPDVEDTW